MPVLQGLLADCPAGVDMATYKAEALYQRYRRRLRPASHYSLGWLPRWAGPDDAVAVAGPAGERVAARRARRGARQAARRHRLTAATCRGSRRRASASGSRRARQARATSGSARRPPVSAGC